MSDDIKIYTPDEVERARGRGEARLSEFTSDQIAALRNRTKHDLFFLAYGILGYDKLSKGLHLDYCRWLKSTNADQFRLTLLPRSHFKSTIATISDSIQITLPDDLGTSEYPRNLGFNVRILIAHEIDKSAQAFLSSIRDFFYRSELLLALYPEITPEKGRTDNKSELELNRTRTWSEGTFNTMGVGGKRQGAHYDYIKADDLQGESATFSKAEKEALIQWTDNLQSYLVTPRTDHIDFTGTRWAYDDVWSHIAKVYGNKLKIYHRAVEEWNADHTEKVPIFPEQFTTVSLDILRQNRRVWTAQYLNNPSEGASTFEEHWLRYWHWYDTRMIAIPNLGSEPDIYSLSSLDKIILIDPAMVGNFGYCIVGTTPKGQHIILKAVKREFKQPEFIDYLFADVQKWNPRMVVIEGVLFSNLYQHWIVTEMSRRRLRFKIETVSTRQKAKEERITGLAPYFNAGQIYFHQEQYDIIQEFKEFGASDNIHILDALAYGPEFWKTPPALHIINSQNEAFAAVNGMRGRDRLTGYSSMGDEDLANGF